jgi:hypothetical protein
LGLLCWNITELGHPHAFSFSQKSSCPARLSEL